MSRCDTPTYGYILETGRVVMEGTTAELAANEDVKEFYLGLSAGERKSYPQCKALSAAQEMAGLNGSEGVNE